MTRGGFAAELASGIRPLLLLGVLIVIAKPLLATSAYELRVFTLVGIYALLALGYQFIFGHAGALSLTQGTFFGVGAYVTAILGTKYGFGAAMTLPFATQQQGFGSGIYGSGNVRGITAGNIQYVPTFIQPNSLLQQNQGGSQKQANTPASDPNNDQKNADQEKTELEQHNSLG